MSFVDEIRARHSTVQGAARELGAGLMRGNPDALQLGYSDINATLACSDAFGLSEGERGELLIFLAAFGQCIRDEDQCRPSLRSLQSKCEVSFDAETLDAVYDAGWAAGELEAGVYPAGDSCFERAVRAPIVLPEHQQRIVRRLLDDMDRERD